MTTKEIKDQLERIIKKELAGKIDDQRLIKKHLNYPIISNLVLLPKHGAIQLNDEQLDQLRDNKSIEIYFEIDGTYNYSSNDGNTTYANKAFKLTHACLKLKIENDVLVALDFTYLLNN